MDEDTFLKCIIDPNRRAILRTLGPDELCVNDIIAATGLEQTLASFHLKFLRISGLVTCRRNGKNILYRVSNHCIMDVFTVIERIISTTNSIGDENGKCKSDSDCE